MEKIKADLEKTIELNQQANDIIDKVIDNLLTQAEDNKIEMLQDDCGDGSIIIAYINDYNYTEVERLYKRGNVISIETNNDVLCLNDLSVSDKINIAERIIDQIENPDFYEVF